MSKQSKNYRNHRKPAETRANKPRILRTVENVGFNEDTLEFTYIKQSRKPQWDSKPFSGTTNAYQHTATNTTGGTGKTDKSNYSDVITNKIIELMSYIPFSAETPLLDHPETRVQELITRASWKAAAVSGVAALPPGPLGLSTLIPELYLIWKIQAQLVSDIAAVYGKQSKIKKEEMFYCLFRHGGAHLFNEMILRVGERYVVRRTTLRYFQSFAKKVGLRITQRLLGKSIARWVPLAGAAGVAWYAKHDTAKVGETAREFFSHEICDEGGGSHEHYAEARESA